MPLIPNPYCSLQTKLFAKPHMVKEWRDMLHLHEIEYPHKLFEILLNGKFTFSFSLITSFISIYLWIFILYIQCYFILGVFLLRLFQLWPLKTLSLGSPVLLTHTCQCVCVWVCVCMCMCFGTFLLSGITRCSRLMSYISSPSPRINSFPKEPWFPLWENDVIN